jgi:membrane associated rhomboid family serine protease
LVIQKWTFQSNQTEINCVIGKSGMATHPAATIVRGAETKIERLPSFLASKIRPYSPRCAACVDFIHIDSPLTTAFILSCTVIHAVSAVVGVDFIHNYFAVPPFAWFSFTSPKSYWRLFSHILGHSSWAHLNGNVVNLLLVMPACERHFGGLALLTIIFYVALASGLAHMFLGAHNSVQLGASGVVFSMIILNSLIEMGQPGQSGTAGRIPLTFLCQICLWCWKEVISQLFSTGTGVSHVAHLVGAVVGTVMGKRLGDRHSHSARGR